MILKLAVGFVFLAPLSANAQLKDISGNQTITTIEIGQAVGMDGYEKALAQIKQLDVQAMSKRMSAKISQGGVSGSQMLSEVEGALFPVSTPSMKPNSKAANELRQTSAMKPIAVVGNDDYSIAWLKANEQELKRLGALVALVEVEDINEYTSITSQVNSIQVLPLSGYPLHLEFGVTEYPALIMKTGIYR